ncbi:hypothetical protein N5T80_09715 [Aliarcobacter cryaerophilus]|uniref:hypothetical protein n=1 Tax=Aliarcobacter cryaerophilus TaxID=28198 RepID=UPI0021B55C3D|nr:hypothetical protein [Aliarcobacter cryaerophilus]MCT7533738.1 hypothetical protein [Aliarcobacter cryaerophilus]MCT7546593.1 hypothetical protein [Aliarcobacter cryaerophilus]
MKKLLILLITSSLSLFATINGNDEIAVVKVLKAKLNIPSMLNHYTSLTDLYIEPNKTSSRGGKEIVYEFTLNSTKDFDFEKMKKRLENEIKDTCKSNEFLFGDKLNNAVVNKYKHLGKTIFQVKLDASMCR